MTVPNVAVTEEFTWVSGVSSVSILRCFAGLVKNASRVLLVDILCRLDTVMIWAHKLKVRNGKFRIFV